MAAFLVVAENATQKMHTLVGPEDPAEARLQNPTSLRALYGKDTVHNGFHVSENPTCVIRVSQDSFCYSLILSQLKSDVT